MILSRGFSLISLSLWTLLSFEGHLHLCLQAGFFVATLTVTVSILYFNTMSSRRREGFHSSHRRTERELRYQKLWQTSLHGSLALIGVWTHFSTNSCDQGMECADWPTSSRVHPQNVGRICHIQTSVRRMTLEGSSMKRRGKWMP